MCDLVNYREILQLCRPGINADRADALGPGMAPGDQAAGANAAYFVIGVVGFGEKSIVNVVIIDDGDLADQAELRRSSPPDGVAVGGAGEVKFALRCWNVRRSERLKVSQEKYKQC